MSTNTRFSAHIRLAPATDRAPVFGFTAADIVHQVVKGSQTIVSAFLAMLNTDSDDASLGNVAKTLFFSASVRFRSPINNHDAFNPSRKTLHDHAKRTGPTLQPIFSPHMLLVRQSYCLMRCKAVLEELLEGDRSHNLAAETLSVLCSTCKYVHTPVEFEKHI